jgi:K+-sensing histidine kinase KdpD
MHSVICGIVPINQLMPYFLMISVVLLLINTALFWPPVYSILICILSYMVIIWLFSYKDRIDRFSVLISHGGGVYFIVSSFSCLIAYNRYQIVKKEIEKNSIIDAANNRLLIQNEKINDQKYVIEEANRKLKVLNDYRHNTLNIMLNDFRNFTGSIQMSLDLLKKSADNLTSEQNEILNYIGTGNEKLNYLSEKLADSAEKEEAQVDFSYETFDINPFIERVVMDIADTAGIKQINLQLHLSPSSILVYLDKLFLGQVLFKLLMNALRYAEKGSVLTIHTHQLNNKCVIEVVNIGGLIGKEKLTELFNKLNPYLTLRESILTGADMGFSVARKLTETMGGSFTFSSEENTGNYYRIEFNYTH